MTYDFDKFVDRSVSHSVKYDLLGERFGNASAIPMWVADMDFETPEFIMDAIKARADHPVLGYTLRTSSWSRSIINWLETRHKWTIDESWIRFSPGVVPGIFLSITGLTRPEDSIVIQPPVYFPFFNLVDDNGRRRLDNPLSKLGDRYHFDLDDFKRKAERAKMLILCNPSNPTGTSWTREELKELGDICVANDILIVSDEIHSDIILHGGKHTPMASVSDEIAERTITMMSASKTFNICGLSTAYAVIPNPRLREKFDHMLETSHLFVGNIFGNVALEAAYTHGEEWLARLIDYLSGNLRYLETTLAESIPSIRIGRTEATFLVWLDFKQTGMSHAEIKRKLIDDACLALNDGLTFGANGEGFFRMNIACPRSTVQEALTRLRHSFG